MLKRPSFVKEHFWKIKVSSKEGIITDIKHGSLKAHCTGTQWLNLGAFLDPGE
jgi:hypothetical protein